MKPLHACAAFVVASLCCTLTSASAQATPDVASILAASARAQGMPALMRMASWHAIGTGKFVGIAGTIDEWTDQRTGDSAQRLDAGPISQTNGFDGVHAWTRDRSNLVWDDASSEAIFGARNNVYRNRYALWTADRGGASVTLESPKTESGRNYDVLRITPPQSVPFDMWIDAATHLPYRVVEKIGTQTTTTTTTDYRRIAGGEIPFHIQVTGDSGDAAFDIKTFDVNASVAAQIARPHTQPTDFSIAGGTSTTVPFTLEDNHVVLHVMIDGKGPYRFIFDTGGDNFLDSGVARELGLVSSGDVQGSGVGSQTESLNFAVLDELRIGDASVRKTTFITAPVRQGFAIASSHSVDGLIGFQVLARFVTTFDYAAGTVTFRLPSAPAPAGGKVTPFVFAGTHIMLDCAIGGAPGKCVIDTGSRIALSVLTPFWTAHPAIVPANATAPGVDGFGLGGPALGRLGQVPLAFGGFTMPGVIADFSSQTQGAFANPYQAGNIGGGVLKRFTVTFDYPRQTIALEPNANFAKPEDFDRSGLFLITQGGKVVVVDARPGTPAAAAGLKRGDVIVTVDGKDASALGAGTLREDFRASAGTTYTLGLTDQSGTTRTVQLVLKDYV